MSVQVAEEGNKRKGGMTSEETEQCIHDILSWFQRKKANLTKSTMESDELESLEKALGHPIPKVLGFLLEKQNGGLWFNEYKDIVSAVEQASSWKNWSSDYIPLAADPDGALIVVDTGNMNEVIEFSEDGKGQRLGSSLNAYLELYRDDLLSNKFDFVEDIGLVQKARK